MMSVETTMRLDEALKRYHELGRQKRTRFLKMISEYVPEDRVQQVLNKSFVGEGLRERES